VAILTDFSVSFVCSRKNMMEQQLKLTSRGVQEFTANLEAILQNLVTRMTRRSRLVHPYTNYPTVRRCACANIVFVYMPSTSAVYNGREMDGRRIIFFFFLVFSTVLDADA
jgi:hypothetical protein